MQEPAIKKTNELISAKVLEMYRKMYWWMVPKEVIIFDIKTTGSSASKDRIIEIGAIRLAKESFLSAGDIDFFHAKTPHESSADSLQNEDDDTQYKHSGTEGFIIKKFFEFSYGSYVYSYNSPRTVKFLEAAAKRHNHPIEDEDVDLIEDIFKFAKKYLIKEALPDKSLENIFKAFGINVNPEENCLNNAIALFHCFMLIKQMEFESENKEILRFGLIAYNEKERFEKLNQTFAEIYK